MCSSDLFLAFLGTFVCMVVALKILSHLHQNFFCYDVDLPVVSFDFVPNLDYPLRVGELIVDARCDLPLLEPSNFLLNMM